MAFRRSRLGDRLRRVEERRQILGRISETRLLKTAITGRVAAGVASSWIDMLAGLSIIRAFDRIWDSRKRPVNSRNICRVEEEAMAKKFRVLQGPH